LPYLYAKRIRLRAAEKEDIPIFLRWVNDAEVAENLLFVTPMSRYEEEQWYDSMMKKPASEHIFVIEVKNLTPDQHYGPVGTCQFHDVSWRNRSAEVGIMIGEKNLWDQGYGTETMGLLLKHGFETLNLHRIWLQVFAKNKRGIRAYEKAGFVFEGQYRQAEYQHGQYQDVHLMSILVEEWRQNQLSKSS